MKVYCGSISNELIKISPEGEMCDQDLSEVQMMNSKWCC